MTSRERVEKALNHEEPDRVPLDLGGTLASGMAASSVHKLRVALGLSKPGDPIKVTEPYQMLGEIDEDLRRSLGVDCISLDSPKNFFGFENKDWKRWKLFDGTPVLVSSAFNTQPDQNGNTSMYPQGDKTASPSASMPKGGFYFDAIIRQEPTVEEKLKVEDHLEEYVPISEEELRYYEQQADYLFRNTEYAIVGSFGGTSFGDIAIVPGMSLKHPKGIRDIEEWYISLLTRGDFVYEIFDRQCEIALSNLEMIRQAVQDKISVIFITGTDFGAQETPFISKGIYNRLFKPFHAKVNDWVHKNTQWRTLIHSCGCVEPLMEDFIQVGFDILNPVQISASKLMDPGHLKQKYGEKIVFWGGGVNTQKTLPFGTSEEIDEEVKKLISIFSQGGGFVFAAVHNIQANIPVENIVALFEAFKKYR
jgi:hypothetical protein